MGLLIGVGNTKPTFPYDYYYGIEWDSNVASSACTRIGRPELHVSLPIQSKMRRCVLRDNGTVAYYLHANDSTKRDTGAAAKLDGTDGQVMVEIPAHYRKFEVDGTKFRCLLSEHALPGFHLVQLAYRSAYEAAGDPPPPALVGYGRCESREGDAYAHTALNDGKTGQQIADFQCFHS